MKILKSQNLALPPWHTRRPFETWCIQHEHQLLLFFLKFFSSCIKLLRTAFVGLVQLCIIFHINMYFSSNSITMLFSFFIYSFSRVLAVYDGWHDGGLNNYKGFDEFSQFVGLTNSFILITKIIIRKFSRHFNIPNQKIHCLSCLTFVFFSSFTTDLHCFPNICGIGDN